MNSDAKSDCPICLKKFSLDEIENHVNRCIFLTSSSTNIPVSNENKRHFGIFNKKSSPSTDRNIKKPKLNLKLNNRLSKVPTSNETSVINLSEDEEVESTLKPLNNDCTTSTKTLKSVETRTESFLSMPLAEKMRPNIIDNYVGQNHITGKNTVIGSVLSTNEIPSMILWGPPGCGKTTLAHIISNRCKESQNFYRFVKLSATMAGVNDVKEIIKIAKNEMNFKRKTILFMDEIHRFNKMQQDIFLSHVENGIIILIGATTENPSFSLNSALLSRCRVIVLEKLTTENLYSILERALKSYNTIVLDESTTVDIKEFKPKMTINRSSVTWLAEMCDGDARIALNTLQLTMQTIAAQEEKICDVENDENVKLITLESLKEGIKKSHLLYDRKGDQHYDTISALHKSIRASDENASLYWCTRMMEGGEDPRFICRRLIRAASEDIGLADPNAISIAVAALQAVQHIGMPEADCIIAQCAVYLARAPKSREIQDALNKCKIDIKYSKGSLPSVPIHLRNAPTKLMSNLGYGKGYNMLNKDESGLQYMPEGLEDRNYFSD